MCQRSTEQIADLGQSENPLRKARIDAVVNQQHGKLPVLFDEGQHHRDALMHALPVGAGLAGLSAATVMVPVMIVLCPSFAGETGAYHATAIALASDILGSAFTSAIYIRHRNIDLRRGGIMLACIITMCVAGSIAAWHAGNVVLGTFSLFLCVGIGIRFLLKPDTEKEKPVKKGAKLDWKGVAVALCLALLGMI